MEVVDLNSCSRLLRSCTIKQGKQLHLYLFKEGLLHSAIFIGNCLLQMYTRCGQLSSARSLFDEMPQRNCFTWNSLIESYLKVGNQEISLELFNSMPQKNDFSWNSLISSFSKGGNLKLARALFNEMPVKNGVAWNSMIHGYARIGRSEEAMSLFKDLNSDPADPSKTDGFILATVIGIGANSVALDHGKQIHSRSIVNNVDFDSVLVSSLINMYSKCGDLDSASQFLNSSQKPDDFSLSALITGYSKCGKLIDARRIFDHSGGGSCVVLWNSMVSGFVANNQGQEALVLFYRMHQDGIRADSSTFSSVLSACASLGVVANGKQIHTLAFKLGFMQDMIVGSVLIDMYSKCGSPDDACKFFDELEEYDTILLNSMINLYSNYRRVEDARQVFERMPNRSLISWNSMIVGYNQNGCAVEALNLFGEMHGLGLRLDKVSLASVISACASTCALRFGEQIFALATIIGLESDQIISTSLIDLYCKCGNTKDGRKLFDEMIKFDEVPWNSMLMGYSTNGFGVEALQLFDEMKKAGVSPNNITFTGVLSACDHCGLVEEGQKLFKSMKEEHNIEPGIEHYSCMIDLFSRAGFVEEAINLIDQMPFEADSSMWSSVLRGCMGNGDEDLGMKVAKRIIELDPKSSTAYVQLSSIHATCGDWEKSAGVRKTMRDRRIQKTPARSWQSLGRNSLLHSGSKGNGSRNDTGPVQPIVALNISPSTTYEASQYAHLSWIPHRKETILLTTRHTQYGNYIYPLIQEVEITLEKEKEVNERLVMEMKMKKQKMLEEEELIMRGQVEEEEFSCCQDKLQRALDDLVECQRSSFENVLSQKSEIQKVLDIMLKESQVMKSKIHELELNSKSIMEKNLNQTKEIEKLIAEKADMKEEKERLMNEKDMELNETSKLLLVKTIVLEEIVSKKAMIEKALMIRNKEFEELSKVNQIMKTLRSPDSDLRYELFESFVELMEELDTLSSVEEENERLKKDTNLAINMLQGDMRRLKHIGNYNARILQDLKTCGKEIFELRKEMKSLRTSLEKVTFERDDVQKELDLKKMDKAERMFRRIWM